MVAGNWICVPPVKSIPRLKPRKAIEQTQITSTTPKPMYQVLRRPTMSNEPVPV